jgi:hypothetical protein
MAKNYDLPVPSKYGFFGLKMTNAMGTNLHSIKTFPTDDCNIINLWATTTDTAANDLYFILNNGVDDLYSWHVDLPAGSGTDGTNNAINCLNATNCPMGLWDDTGLNKYLPGVGGVILKVVPRVTITSGKFIFLSGVIADFTA